MLAGEKPMKKISTRKKRMDIHSAKKLLPYFFAMEAMASSQWVSLANWRLP